MRVFTFRYEKDGFASGMRRMDTAIRTDKPYIREHEMVCTSLPAMFKFASTPKFEVFDAVVAYRPQSLYEVAQILGKDQGQVLRDAKSLAALGLIKLVPWKEGGREKLKPEPLYDKIVFEVEPKKRARSA